MLSPKKTGNFTKKTWKDLDSLLQNTIDPSLKSHPSATIFVSDYEMSKDDIISEAQKNGYTVNDEGDYLEFY
ncbi:hypothetical protein [Macrococcus capreoli]|uniref:hypothetical protein n=1 Tax=Macrococcus capreoli TaxID=2982690 RepID=UPI003EE4382F